MSTRKPESDAARPTSGLSYAALQRWFLAGVVTPETEAATAEPIPTIESVILPSRTLAPSDRLAIYREMYFHRLRDVLVDAYPALAHVLGQAAFTVLSHAYVQCYPSRSYTLNDLGRALPHFLATNPGVITSLPQLAYPAQPEFLCDLARIEWATSEAFDARIQAPITSADIAAIEPENWPEIRFRMHPSVRLLALSHNALAILNAVHANDALPDPDPAAHFVIVWRQAFTVWRKSLPAAAHAILASLARGDALGLAMEAAPAHWDGSDEELEQSIFQWFAEWLEEGLFATLRPDATQS